jgi:hypothetical protein
MIKKEIVVDEVELNDEGNVKALKGRVVKVIEISDMNRNFLNHQFSKDTLMEIHKAEWKVLDNIIDYAGG